MSPTVAAVAPPPKQPHPKGKRVPGKPGRFDPDQPLHMTTRRAGKKSVSGSAQSANGSIEDFQSHRLSFDAERPVTANSSGSKGTYASDFSPPDPIPDVNMSEAPAMLSFEEAVNGERTSRSPSRNQQTSPTTRKRKRSSPSPPPSAAKDAMAKVTVGETPARLPEDHYEGDNVQVLRHDELSDREESEDEADEIQDRSGASSQSHEAAAPYDAVAGTSVDVTPMLSEQPSPATSGTPEEQDQEPDTIIAKPLAAALREVVKGKKADLAEEEQPEDVTMLDATQAIEDADEIEEQVRTDEEGRTVVRKGKFGGRRRAQHPNVNIEAAMRRQAQLKSMFRSLARAQKNILVEVTQRTIDELEASPSHHTEVEEYENVMQDLDTMLAERKAAIHAQHEMKKKQLKTVWNREQEAAATNCRQRLNDLEEAKVDQMEYEFLQIARKAQLEDDNETEDEDDVVPKLKRMAYHFKRGNGLDPAFDSRSRLAIETRRATEDMRSRFSMHEMLKRLPDEDRPEERNGFTIMDERPRTAASTNREGQANLEILAAAGAETERIARIPVMANDQAHGLKMLSDLASRPSIVGDRRESSASMSGPMNTGPPQLHTQVPRGPSPIQVTMSPRTQHAMGNRFEANQMPPPLTPRQEVSAAADRSSEGRRSDYQHQHPPSTPKQDEWPNGVQARPRNEALRSPAQPPVNEPNNLRSRIASRDGMLQESLFGSPRAFPDLPGFRQFDAPGSARRRAASHSDPAPPFGVGIRSDPTPGVQHEHERQEPGKPDVRSNVRPGAPRYDPVRSEAARLPDQPSEAGASNGVNHETGTRKSDAFSLDFAGPQDPTGPTQDAAGASKNVQHAKKTSRGGNFHKTNKDQRGGQSRKKFSKEKKQQQQQQMENGRPDSAGAPTMGNAQHYIGSPAMDLRSQSPWGPSPLPGMGFPHDFPQHQHRGAYSGPGGPPYGPPPPQGFGHHPPMHDHQRRSLDLSGLHHQGDPYGHPYVQPRPPHSPFFRPLPQFPQPPPPGVAHEQYRQQNFPAVGPGGPLPFGPPPGLPQQPSTPQPGPQGFGGGLSRGQAIAPAGGAGVFQPGSNRAPMKFPPAFAQQQQQQNGGGDRRRRTQSDAGFAKFQPPWQPKEKR